MKLVVDSNIWLGSNFLRSPNGLSLTAYSTKTWHKLVVHEVVEREVEFNFKREASDRIEKIRKEYNYLLSNLGRAMELILPTPSEIESALKSRFSQLENIIERMPFNFTQAQRALSMAIEHLPPNGESNQQFKDSIIWAFCLELSASNKVKFITEDKGFFKERNPKKGLADSIATDIESTNGNLQIYFGLGEFLKEHFSADKIVKNEELAERLFAKEKSKIEKFVEEFVVTLGDLKIIVKGKFLTENDGVLSLNYEGEIEVKDHIPTIKEPIYSVTGTCLYDIGKKELLQSYLNSTNFSWIDNDGLRQEKKKQYVYGVANMTIGHRTVEYFLRHELS